jgi:hypothetical protein
MVLLFQVVVGLMLVRWFLLRLVRPFLVHLALNTLAQVGRVQEVSRDAEAATLCLSRLQQLHP